MNYYTPMHNYQLFSVCNVTSSVMRSDKIWQSTIRTKEKHVSQLTHDQFNALINLYRSGQLSEAEQTCRELLQSHPQSSMVLCVLGAVLQDLGRLEQAVQSYDKALQIKPDNAGAYYDRGIALQKLGQSEAALKSYDTVIRLKPDFADAYYNRGIANQDLGQLVQAVESFDTAIQIKPDHANAFYNRGMALQKLGQLEAARKSYDEAIRLKPDFADACYNRGTALQDLGQLEQAEKSFEKAIQIKPEYAKAHYSLSMLKEYQPQDARTELMESLFTGLEPGESDRLFLCFALAKDYEDLGEYDKSFNYLQEGNRLRQRELNYNIDDDRRLVNRIRENFTAGSLDFEFSPGGDTSIQPLFIVGMPRSGTTLVEQILASHSKVHGAGELEAMGRLASSILLNLPDQKASKGKVQLSRDDIKNVHDAYLEQLVALKVPEKIITDKLPLNFLWIGFILCAYPKAKIIHLNRDPRATCWSIYKQNFSGKENGYAYDLTDLVAFYKLYIDLMSFWRNRFPNTIYDLCYEDLTENQEKETRKLLTYCDLQWEKQCLDFHKTRRIVKTSSVAQVQKKMYQGSSEAWRKYAVHLQPLIKELAY